MQITNGTAVNLTIGQKLYMTVVPSGNFTNEFDGILEIVAIRKSKKSPSGLRVQVKVLDGGPCCHGGTITDFEVSGVSFRDYK